MKKNASICVICDADVQQSDFDAIEKRLEEFVGQDGYQALKTLKMLNVRIEPDRVDQIAEAMKDLPGVQTVSVRKPQLLEPHEKTGEHVGKTLSELKALLGEDNVRVIGEDGVGFMGTCDLHPWRTNVVVEDGIVVQSYMG